MIYNKKMGYEEAQGIITNFFKNETPLEHNLVKEIPNLETLLGIILDNIEYAMAHPTEPKNDHTLLDGDKERITYLNYLLPSFYLEDKYDNFYDFLGAYMLLINNYIIVYHTDLEAKFIGAVKALNNLMEVESNFTRLIEISKLLIGKYEKTKTFKEEPFSISRSYLKAMYDEEDKNDQGTNTIAEK